MMTRTRRPTAAEVSADIEATRRLRDVRARFALAMANIMAASAGGRPRWDDTELAPQSRAAAIAAWDRYEHAAGLLAAAVADPPPSPAELREQVNDAVGCIPVDAIVPGLEYAAALEAGTAGTARA